MSDGSPANPAELARYQELLRPLEGLPTSGSHELPEDEAASYRAAVQTLRGYHGDHLELEEAVSAFARVLWRAPAWAEPPARIAEALVTRARQWPEGTRREACKLANRLAQRALSLDPVCRPARIAQARIAILEGSPAEAERLAAVLPGHEPATLSLRSEIAEARGDLDQAITLRRQHIDVESDTGALRNARNKLGLLEHAAGDREGAVATHRENLARHPDYAWGHVNLAAALEESGELLEALAELETALSLGLQDARPYLEELAVRADREALAGFRRLLRASRDGEPWNPCPDLTGGAPAQEA